MLERLEKWTLVRVQGMCCIGCFETSLWNILFIKNKNPFPEVAKLKFNSSQKLKLKVQQSWKREIDAAQIFDCRSGDLGNWTE